MSRLNSLLYYPGNIIDGDENHQAYKDEKSYFLKGKLLGEGGWSTSGHLPEEKCKLSPIQRGNGEDIYQGQIQADKGQ